MPDLALAVAQTVPRPRDVESNVRRHAQLTSLAADRGARLVLFPELSLTGYDHELTADDAIAVTDPRLRPLQAVADRQDVVAVVGAPVVSDSGLHIASLTFVPGGETRTYLKPHVHDSEQPTFVSGNGGEPIHIDDEEVGLAICADLTHPEHARAAATRGATIYAASCLLTETGYVGDAELLQRYAREHRMVVLMANYGAPASRWPSAGKSAIWSEEGTRVACAPADGEAVVIGTRSNHQWTGDVVCTGPASG